MNIQTNHTFRPKTGNRQTGFGLVELMIGLALGLFLVAGVVTLYISNSQVSRVTGGLSHLQDTARASLSMLGHDIREAGASPCGGSSLTTSEVAIFHESSLNAGKTPSPNLWWASLRYSSSAADGANAFRIWDRGTVTTAVSPFNAPAFVARPPHPESPVIMLTRTGDHVALVGSMLNNRTFQYFPGSSTDGGVIHPVFNDKDLAFICNFGTSRTFQTASSTDNGRVIRAYGGASSDQNFGDDFESESGADYVGGSLARFEPVVWYIANNGFGDQSWNGRSLMRGTYREGEWIVEEIAPGVECMEARVKRASDNTFVSRATGTTPWRNWSADQWGQVTGVEVTLQIATIDNNLATPDSGTSTNYDSLCSIDNAASSGPRPMRSQISLSTAVRSRVP